jgi:hypothetical protein
LANFDFAKVTGNKIMLVIPAASKIANTTSKPTAVLMIVEMLRLDLTADVTVVTGLSIYFFLSFFLSGLAAN